jgi:hypothetical protein
MGYTQEFLKELRQRNAMFLNTTTLEDVLCLSTMIANKNTLQVENVDDAREEYLRTFDGDCQKCPYVENCLACFINE